MKKISWADYMLPADQIHSDLFPEDTSNTQNLEHVKKVMMEMIKCELTPRQRQILVLYYFKGYNIPKIAEMLGLNKSTVSRTLGRAVDKLRSHLKYFKTR